MRQKWRTCQKKTNNTQRKMLHWKEAEGIWRQTVGKGQRQKNEI